MCGLVGIFDRGGPREIDPALLTRMSSSIIHRGPDESDQFIAPGVGLGHRRLAIIDLKSGQQPLFNEDRSVVIVYNGEIFNFQELMRELDAYLGDRPATDEELAHNVKNAVRSLPGEFETSGAVLTALLSNRRYGRPDDYVQNLKANYEALDVADLRDAAAEVLHPQSLTWLIVGDLEKIERPVRDLGLGEVRILETR